MTAKPLLERALGLQREGRRQEAAALLQEILRIEPLNFDALHLLGLLCHGAGRNDLAADLLQAAARVRPSSALAQGNLALVLAALDRKPEAEAAYREAIRLDPGFAEAHYNLGNLLNAAGRQEEAVAAYRDAVAAAPGLTAAWRNLADVEQDVGAYEEAREALDRLVALDPSPGQRLRAALVLPTIPASREQIVEARRRLLDGVEALRRERISLADPYREVGVTTFHLAYHGLSDRPLQEALSSLYLQACPDLAWTAPHCREPRRPQRSRPRVGLISAYFTGHTIGKLYIRMAELFDTERFELVLFRLGTDSSPMARRFDAAASRVVCLPESLPEARRLVAEAELDLLFYPDIGMNPFTYYLAHARLAPVQCVSWGHPDTTGIPNQDYFISSEGIEPEGAEAEYTERLVKFRRMPCCYSPPPIPDPADRGRFGLPEAGNLYVCAQATFKFHPDFDAVLARILRSDPKGLVVITTGRRRQWTEHLRRRIAIRHPDVAERIRLAPRMSPVDYLRLHMLADAALDPPYFAGGNSSYEIFQLGTPIVTHLGLFMRARPTSGMYRQMEIPDLMARDLDHYAELAVRTGTEPDFRNDLARRIRERNAVLYDDRQVVGEFEDFFEKAIREASA